MNTLVAVVSVAIVAGLAAWGINAVLGEFAILVWIGLGFCGFLGLMAKINS